MRTNELKGWSFFAHEVSQSMLLKKREEVCKHTSDAQKQYENLASKTDRRGPAALRRSAWCVRRPYPLKDYGARFSRANGFINESRARSVAVLTVHRTVIHCRSPSSPSIFSSKRKSPMQGFFFWSGLRGSNPPPPPWQGGALPNELNPQIWCLRSELNQRHGDFQSPALPTELQRQNFGDPEGARTPDL